MPIYEFYCSGCHTIFSFLSRTVNTKKRPACPACGRPRLSRRASRFAISSGRSEASPENGLPDLDEAKMERAFEALARDAEGLDENDPRAMAHVMRKLHDSGGLPMGPGMDEALRRLEAGEDPDDIEADLGELIEQEEPLSETGGGRLGALRHRLRAPKVDRHLYEM